MHLHLDAIGGVAGDMFAACVTDAFPDLRPGMLETLRQVGLPDAIVCGFEAHNDGTLSGSRFLVDIPKRLIGQNAVGHTPFSRIRADIESAPIAPQVKARAIDIFRRLAEVEAGIHGSTVEEVGFHELGGWDSIADMVGAAYLITHLNIETCSVSTLPLGSGRVKTSHGPLPVPVPAVAKLLEGYEFIDDGIGGERITPTGAAILRHLDARQGTRKGGTLKASGYGFGSKRFPGISNVLRAVLLNQGSAQQPEDTVARITFEVDDQTPEDLAIGLDRIREQDGVLDVIQLAAYGKKGRMSVQIQVLATPQSLESVCDACLTETSTLGVRHETVQRRTVARASVTVDADGKPVRVKLAQRPSARTAKAESDDVRSHAGDRAEREALRQKATAQAVSGARR